MIRGEASALAAPAISGARIGASKPELTMAPGTNRMAAVMRKIFRCCLYRAKASFSRSITPLGGASTAGSTTDGMLPPLPAWGATTQSGADLARRGPLWAPEASAMGTPWLGVSTGGGTPSLRTGGGGTSLGEAEGMGIWIGRDGRERSGRTGTPPEGVRAGNTARGGRPHRDAARRGVRHRPLAGARADPLLRHQHRRRARPWWGRRPSRAEVGWRRGCPWGGRAARRGALGRAGGRGRARDRAELPGSLAPGCWNISMVFLAAEAGPSDLPVSGQNFVPSSWSLPQ